MTKIAAKDVAELRRRTGAGMMECKKALQETDGDTEAAVDYLRKKGVAKADKRADRTATEGIIASYVHFNGQVAAMVEVNCETDFVARTDDFQNLARDLALHITSANPVAISAADLPQELLDRERRIAQEQVAEAGKPEAVRDKIVEGKVKKFAQERALVEQSFVKNDKQTVAELIKEISAKVGENIVVRRFVRYQIGDEG